MLNHYPKLAKEFAQYFEFKTLDYYLGLQGHAEELCASLILDYFLTGGVGDKTKEWSLEKVRETLGAEEKYRKMLLFLINFLRKKGVLEGPTESFRFLKDNTNLLSPTDALKRIRDLHSQFSPFFSFLFDCVQSYPDVLQGKKPGVDVLYPNGNTSRLQRIYENTPKVGYESFYLNLLREVLNQEILQNDREKPLTIVEVGSGQGILTEILLPMLPSNTTYYFTDMGRSIVLQGKQRFNGTTQGTMRFEALDITKDPIEQGFTAEMADFVVGFNVVHATPNIGDTLSEMSKLLKNDGKIFLVENVKQEPWIDMIYGLVEGWWLFDDGIRSDSPLLSIDRWDQVIGQGGFQNHCILPAEEDFMARQDSESALISIQK